MDITFYELRHSPFEKVIARLCSKIYEQKLRAVVAADHMERLQVIDQTLWTFSKLSFLPHGHAGTTPGEAARQPIWLSLEVESPNHADVLVLMSHKIPENISSFKRILDLFEGIPEHTEKAQQRFAQYQKNGHACSWWIEEPAGSWKRSV